MGMIDFSLRKLEHGDPPFTATLLSEPGGALRLQEHSIGEIEPLLRVLRRLSGQQKLDQFLRSLPARREVVCARRSGPFYADLHAVSSR